MTDELDAFFSINGVARDDFAVDLLFLVSLVRTDAEEKDFALFRDHIAELDEKVWELLKHGHIEAAIWYADDDRGYKKATDWDGLHGSDDIEWGPYTGARRWRWSAHELAFVVANTWLEKYKGLLGTTFLHPGHNVVSLYDRLGDKIFDRVEEAWTNEFADASLAPLCEAIEAELSKMNGWEVTPEPIDWHKDGGIVLYDIAQLLKALAEAAFPSEPEAESTNVRLFRESIRELRRIYRRIEASEEFSDIYADAWLEEYIARYCGRCGESLLVLTLELGSQVANAPATESCGWPLGHEDVMEFRAFCRDTLESFTVSTFEELRSRISRMANKDVVERLQGQSTSVEIGPNEPRLDDEMSHGMGMPSPHKSTASRPSGYASLQDHCATADAQPFTGGDLVFHADRIELCGVDICSGRRSSSRRAVLELLSRKRKGGGFIAYSGDELQQQLRKCGQNASVGGLIRGLRSDIVAFLLSQAGIECNHKDVILSAGPGYRLAEVVSVHYVDPPLITDIEKTADVHNVGNSVGNDPSTRMAWILQQLNNNSRLKAPEVAAYFNCTLRTAERDLAALKDEAKIEYVGPRRTGYYRLCPMPRFDL